jgi:hypothetical protein
MTFALATGQLFCADPPLMLQLILCRALPLAFVALFTTSPMVLAEDPLRAPGGTLREPQEPANSGTVWSAASTTAATIAVPADTEHWTAYGFNISAPSSMWPMLELLHKLHFDWELASATQRPTPLVWASLPGGVYGQYAPRLNVVRVSWVLQSSSVEVATAFLAHELTHLTDDLNGKLGDMNGSACYEAETRAFVNEANFWQMVVGPLGKNTVDPIEIQENAKMFAFVGNSHFADLVVRTTASYVKQCGLG